MRFQHELKIKKSLVSRDEAEKEYRQACDKAQEGYDKWVQDTKQCLQVIDWLK